MGDDIGQRDRDQRVHEAAPELGRGVVLPHRLHADDAQSVDPGHDEHDTDEADRERDLQRGLGVEAEVQEAVLELDAQAVRPRPQRPLREAVERRRADHRAQQRDRARHRVQPRRPAQERPPAQLAALPVQWGQPREEAEVDPERVAEARPRLGAIDAHADDLRRRVGQDHHRQGARVGLVRVRQLDPRERQDPERRRPAPEPVRIRDRVRPGADALHQPAGAAADRQPRIERAEDVAEDEAQDRDADPEQDVDHRRGEIAERVLHARQAAVDGEAEQNHSERAEQHVHDHRQGNHTPPGGLLLEASCGPQHPLLAHVLEPRPGPQHRKPDERDHEDERRAPGEQPARDRQVLLADKAVRARGRRQCERRGEDDRPRRGEPPPHGSTWSDAICCPAFSSSMTNLPSIDAGNEKCTLPPFVTSLCRS